MIRIKPEFNLEKAAKEFNEYIKEIIDIIENGEPTEIMGKTYIGITQRKNEYNYILEIIPSLLLQKTNILDILNRRKYILDENIIQEAIHSIMQDKIDLHDENLYNEFFKSLDANLKSKMREYTFIFLLNIETEIKNNGKFKEFLKGFGLESFDIADLNKILHKKQSSTILPNDELKCSYLFEGINADELLSLFKGCSELIRVDISGRNFAYAEFEANSKIKSFLGFLSCINEIWRTKEYFGMAFDEFNLSNIDYRAVVVIIDNEIFWPNYIERCVEIKQKIENYNEIINEELLKNILEVYQDYITKIELESFKTLLNKSFSIYYSACTEIKLEYSFLMFWSLSEMLIKWKIRRTDEELIEIMQSFVNPYLAKRIEFVKDKRDALVHRGEIAKIYSSDRNISKLIADVFLNAALTNMKDLKTREEYYELLNSNLCSV